MLIVIIRHTRDAERSILLSVPVLHCSTTALAAWVLSNYQNIWLGPPKSSRTIMSVKVLNLWYLKNTGKEDRICYLKSCLCWSAKRCNHKRPHSSDQLRETDLNPRNYLYFNSSDLLSDRFGFRFRRSLSTCRRSSTEQGSKGSPNIFDYSPEKADKNWLVVGRKLALFLWKRGLGFVPSQPDVWKLKERYWFSIKPFSPPFHSFRHLFHPPCCPRARFFSPLAIPQWSVRQPSHKTMRVEWWKGFWLWQTRGGEKGDAIYDSG